MANIALIIAGGAGHRMQQDIPKQFINVYDKPVLIYTLEGFQKHPQIDAIELVCIDGWQDMVWAYAKQFNITKLKWIVPGGNSGQESIRNGVFNLEGELKDDDILVLVTVTVPHDLTKMTVNLMGPFVINVADMKGVQTIVENDNYPVKFPIYDILKKNKESKEG